MPSVRGNRLLLRLDRESFDEREKVLYVESSSVFLLQKGSEGFERTFNKPSALLTSCIPLSLKSNRAAQFCSKNAKRSWRAE
jgi:hypothetical protein